jgi:hypothetical protein
MFVSFPKKKTNTKNKTKQKSNNQTNKQKPTNVQNCKTVGYSPHEVSCPFAD